MISFREARAGSFVGVCSAVGTLGGRGCDAGQLAGGSCWDQEIKTKEVGG